MFLTPSEVSDRLRPVCSKCHRAEVAHLLTYIHLLSDYRSYDWVIFTTLLCFLQSTLGYIALLIAIFHGLLFGWKRAFEEEAYRFYLPPCFVVALALPVCVILGKVLMLLPCVARKLHKIRRGLDSGHYRCKRLEPVGSAGQISPERVTIMWYVCHNHFHLYCHS